MTKTKTLFALLGVLAIMMGASAMASQSQNTPSAKNDPVLVDINSADVTELMLIPGIGKAKAEAILNYRSQKRFETVEDLLEVKGIGEKLLAKIRPYVFISPNLKSPGTAVTQNKG